ncbi:hypothetical protein KAH55_04845, partial [bacterium]|nr:hypothetical protein [bacterium]
FTSAHVQERETPDQWGKLDSKNNIGISTKFGINSSITVEFTYNPDFSQVESDAFQVNVNQRFPNFYQEKRPFFMEGLEILNFGTIPHGYMEKPVDTRNIVSPEWGAKLSGSAGKTTFGVLVASDKSPSEIEDDQSLAGKNATTIIARTKRSLGEDNYVGTIYSSRQLGTNRNYVAGIDAQYRFFPNGQTAFSYLHSYTKPDSTGQYVCGQGFNISTEYQNQKYGMMAAYEYYTPDYKMESSFQNRTGISNGWVWVSRNYYPEWKKLPWVKRVTPDLVSSYTHDLQTKMDDGEISADVIIQTTRQGFVYFEGAHKMESYEGKTFYGSNFNINNEIQITKWLGYGIFLSHRDRIYYDGKPPYQGKANIAKLELTWQPGTKIKQNFEVYHENFYTNDGIKHIYEVNIINSRTTYQANKYWLFRITMNYDSYGHLLISDIL